MSAVFYISAAVAVIATAMVITGRNPVHALLYMVVSLLAVAVIFYTLGAPFVAALEVIVYAGAIVVLFLFGVMVLNLGPQSAEAEGQLLRASMWPGPAALAAVLLAEVLCILWAKGDGGRAGAETVSPQQVGAALFGPYVIAVELASLLLLAGLVGAYHLGRHLHVTSMEDADGDGAD